MYVHYHKLVALHVRAWIETQVRFESKEKRAVALHVRAWIETMKQLYLCKS